MSARRRCERGILRLLFAAMTRWGIVLVRGAWASWALLTRVEGGALTDREAPSLAERLAHARAILSEVPLIDGHNDLVMNIRTVLENQLEDFPFDKNLTEVEPWASRSNCHTDIPRLRAGQVGAQFWSAYVPCRSQYKNALTQTLEQIDVIHRLVDKFPEDLQLVTSSEGILNAHAHGKIGCMVGVEGGHSMDSSLGTLRTFYRQGVRYMTLTHMCNTPWADNSAAEPEHLEFDGLTAWGETVVKEMNRLGMLVDISHVASQTMNDVLDITRAPVIFSHSDTRALCNITRNIPDDVLVRLMELPLQRTENGAISTNLISDSLTDPHFGFCRRVHENGGIAMVNFLPDFLSCSSTATLQDVVAHINHIRDIAGPDHVGLGSDYEGITTVPEGLEDVSKYPYIFAELLLDPKWTDEDLKKLAGMNLIRVFQEVERLASLSTNLFRFIYPFLPLHWVSYTASP
ncbi:Dipeptidase 1 [Penaeus vannamei]|uniref:Dipeptidase n=1 Tax=Penaeus vannamei TaxID=6689 RepID=A0A3R7P503_PENVA|nr:Dipeptidase 1 [Penaeus vannamei]